MWRTLETIGCERGELLSRGDDWILRGTILRFGEDGPAEVRYEIVSDAAWHTKAADVDCRDNFGYRKLRLTCEGRRWYANQKPLSLPPDCIDVDLSWSPSTNTLPIRRLQLKAGSSSGIVTAAWIRFPELTVEPLQQVYERIEQRNGQETYIYSSHAGAFKASLPVDENCLVIDYEGLWERVDCAKA
jgi:hypothetical protein